MTARTRRLRVPEQFGYLADVLGKYGWIGSVQDIRRFLERAPEGAIGDLERAYVNIHEHGDEERIPRWVTHIPEDIGARNARWTMIQLLTIFDVLADMAIEPFTSRRVHYKRQERLSIGWSSLPADLRYLAESASKYGVIRTDCEIDEFLSGMDEGMEEELASLAERIRMNDHAPLMNSWIDEHAESNEARLLYFLLGVMDALGLQWEGPQR